MNENKKLDLKYRMEIAKLQNHLSELKQGNIRQLSKNTTHSSHEQLANYIEEDINDLLVKIISDKPGYHEQIFGI